MDEHVLERAKNDVPGFAVVPALVFERERLAVREHRQDVLEGDAVLFEVVLVLALVPTRTCGNVATDVATINGRLRRLLSTALERRWGCKADGCRWQERAGENSYDRVSWLTPFSTFQDVP
jgi:hypothetical protein